MKKTILYFFSCLVCSFYSPNAFGQEARWDAYIAEYEKGPGSITLNMSLIEVSPKKALPFVLITGVTYSPCRPDGFPEKGTFEKLYQISDRVEEKVKTLTHLEVVGTFIYQCERLSYIYVSDTNEIRTQLQEIYTKEFPAYTYYINLKPDAEWKAYRDFLYPNEETQEYMSNEKVIASLMAAGDRLTKARLVEHWLYFSSKKDRDAFILYAKSEKYVIVSEEFSKDGELPYQLRISKVEKVDANSIHEITSKLRKQAKNLRGLYDGWETLVVKE